MSRPPTQRNAASPESVSDATGAQRRAEAREAIDWREFAASTGGRRILAWLLEPIGQLSYTPHANDTAYREGMRAMARNVRAKVCQHAPEALVLLATAEVEQLQHQKVSEAVPEVKPEL